MSTKSSKTQKEKATQMIRLSSEQATALKKVGTIIGLSQSKMVHLAVEAMLHKVEKSGGKMTLPFRLDD